MDLKDTWVDKKNDDDYIDANDINMVANAVIENEKNKADKNDVYTKEEVDEFLTEKATVTETDRRLYSVPSAGLEIVDGVVVGIGSCRDEHIVIPEVDGEGNDVYAVADGVFGYLLGTEGEFIKSITFPPSVKWFGGESSIDDSIIYGVTCPNLEAVYILNPKIDWSGTDPSPFKLPGTTKDVYFGGTKKQWKELNTGRFLIQLSDENIAAGIVPTLHYGYFAASSEVERLEKSFANLEENVGSIDTALDELHAYAQALIGGEA